MKVPTLPLDQRDRKALGMAGVIIIAYFIAVLTIAAGLGLGVRVFLALSGLQ